ncbi:hypothetical protein BGX26_008476 [Mortierella sp. AD094]|nr:hypothetical protein BGX26_008476 [Mortierella sp. AD094]
MVEATSASGVCTNLRILNHKEGGVNNKELTIVFSKLKELKDLQAVKYLDSTSFWNLSKLSPTVEKTNQV